MKLGTTILELRKQKNITQEELAAELGVTAAAVSKWENGYTLPDILMLCALADYFGVTTDELLGRTATTKEAAIVAPSEELASKICQLVEQHGFTVAARFSAYRPALSYTLEQEACNHIFVGQHDSLSADEIDDTPSHINCVHSFGDKDDNILQGFEEIFAHMPSLFK